MHEAVTAQPGEPASSPSGTESPAEIIKTHLLRVLFKGLKGQVDDKLENNTTKL